MKKILLVSALCLSSSLLLFGCGNGQDASLTNLANQIDLLNNTVNSVSAVSQEIPSLSSLTKEQAINYSGIYQSTKDIVANQNSYKTAILAKTSLIKNKIANKDLKLTNQNIKALTDLTQTLSKDTKRLNETKSEFKNSISDMNKSITANKSSISQVSAKINRLSNCMDTQNCYYKNLLNTLNNIEEIMEIYDDSFDYSTINIPLPQRPEKPSGEDFEKLFYEYMINQNLSTQDDKNSDENKDTNSSNNQNVTQNQPIYPTMYPNYGYNGYNPYFYGGNVRNYMPYGGGYYGYYGAYRTNPYRNTDTFAPYLRNIDTYRAPTGMRNYNNLNQSMPVFNENNQGNSDDNEESKIEIVKENTNLTTKNNVFTKIQKGETKKSQQKSNFAGKTYEMNKKFDFKLDKKTFFDQKSKGHTNTLSFPRSKNEKLENLIRKKS